MVADVKSRYLCEGRTEQDKIDTQLIDRDISSRAVSFLTVGNWVAVTLDIVGEKTLKDTKMMELMSLIREGFPDKIEKIPTDYREFHEFRDNSSIVHDVIPYKLRILIHSSLNYTVLRSLHSVHQGVTSMIAGAESFIFW